MKRVMKMRYLALILTVTVGITGCVTTEKLTKPKGNWTQVNPAGFIPPNIQIYKRPSPQNLELLKNALPQDDAKAVVQGTYTDNLSKDKK